MKTKEIIELLNDMTLDEKIGQMVQVAGDIFLLDDINVATGPLKDLEFTNEMLYNVGSILNVVGSERVKKVQLESNIAGANVNFSPMVDLSRDARWGRVMESIGGEDPYLGQVYAKEMVRAYRYDVKNICKQPKRINEQKLLYAKETETIILALGEHYRQSGEACSRSNIELPKNQIKLINELSKMNKPMVMLLFNGRLLQLNNIENKLDAILEVWFPETMGAEAITEVLFGDVPIWKINNELSTKCRAVSDILQSFRV